jgi:hypothetical protein
MADGDNITPIRPDVQLKTNRPGLIRGAQANIAIAAMHVTRWTEVCLERPDDAVAGIMAQHAIREVCEALSEMQAALSFKDGQPEPQPLSPVRAMLEASVAAIPPTGPDAA